MSLHPIYYQVMLCLFVLDSCLKVGCEIDDEFTAAFVSLISTELLSQPVNEKDQ